MNDPALVSHMDSLCDRRHQSRSLDGWLGSAPQALGQTATLDVFHREVRASIKVTDIVDLHDVRMM
jgi:hypothetical protein